MDYLEVEILHFADFLGKKVSPVVQSTDWATPLCFWSGGYTKSSAGARLIIIIIIMLTRQIFNELRMLSSITLTYSRQNAIIIL